MIRSLLEFQQAFARALHDGETSDSTVAALTAQPGFSVYRNTVKKGCVDALIANYPAVARLVGDEWFRAAAALFVRQYPPRLPMLVNYGEAFPEFLATFEPAAELPYLSDVARLDRFWTEAHIAADQAPITARAVASLEPDELMRIALRPLPSARWKWFADQPIFSLWRCNRYDPDVDALRTLAWRGEGALVVRPYGAVEAVELSIGGCAFVDACAAGAQLAQAGRAALDAEPGIDLSALMAKLLQAGTFAQVRS